MNNIKHNGLRYSAMKWGFNGDINSDRLRQSDTDKWFYEYDEKLARWPLSFAEECMIAAGQIYDGTDLPIQVLLSGGYDSMAVTDAFREAGVPFEVITLKMKYGYNEHDIKHARDYCQAYGIKQTFMDLDIKRFWRYKLEDFTYPVQCPKLAPATINWVIDQLDGYPVMGESYIGLENGLENKLDYRARVGGNYIGLGNDALWPENDLENKKVIVVGEGEVSSGNIWERWLHYRNRPGCPKFYRYSNELRLSQLINPVTLEWIKVKSLAGTMGWASTNKKHWYLVQFPHFQDISPIKLPGTTSGGFYAYHGYEFLKDAAKPYYRNLRNNITAYARNQKTDRYCSFEDELGKIIGKNDIFSNRKKMVMKKIEAPEELKRTLKKIERK